MTTSIAHPTRRSVLLGAAAMRLMLKDDLYFPEER